VTSVNMIDPSTNVIHYILWSYIVQMSHVLRWRSMSWNCQYYGSQ